jgi:predicted RNase H-like HicB family nuclease
MKILTSNEVARLARNYPLNVRWSDEDQAFIGSIPGLVGECCHGTTPENVVTQLRDIAEDIVAHLYAKGEQLPSPRLPAGSL